MTNKEFSDTFDTLISAHLHRALFNETSAISDISLDEYEKSVFLTQAQDQILKSFFDSSLNSTNLGLDDSSIRLFDYSNLITTITFNTLKRSADECFSDNGIILNFDGDSFGYVSTRTLEVYPKTPMFIINERVITSDNKSYVVVPIHYKEYDRLLSKAYCEPLKRLAWRLFETDSFTLKSSIELILRSDAASFKEYKVRYIRKPKPIILTDLDDSFNRLSINGLSKESSCELNDSVHNEILLLAVQLALTSRGIETPDIKAASNSETNKND